MSRVSSRQQSSTRLSSSPTSLPEWQQVLQPEPLVVESKSIQKKRPGSRRSQSRSHSPKDRHGDKNRRRRSRSFGKGKFGRRSRSPEKSRERERDKNEIKRKLIPQTLGELVHETAKTKKLHSPSPKRRCASDDDEENSARGEQRLKSRPSEDLPILTEEDLKQEIIMNPDPPFNPQTMKIKSRSSSASVVSNTYLKTDGCIFSSHTERCILQRFNKNVLDFLKKARDSQPSCSMLPPPPTHETCKCGKNYDEYSSESSSTSDSSDDEETDTQKMSKSRRNKENLKKEIERKQNHPARIHDGLIFNEPGMTNDGPVCRCPPKIRNEGIRHQVFVGEGTIPPCNPNSNNADRLYHYVLSVNNAVNPYGVKATSINYGNAVYTFKGFSVFFHKPLPEVFPRHPISRWNTEIEFEFIEEPIPENFTVAELEVFSTYILEYVLELYDFPRFPVRANSPTCPIYHFMPRYISTEGKSSTLLSMSIVLEHIERNFRQYVSPVDAQDKMACCEEQFQCFSMNSRNLLLINPYKRPATLRVDGFVRYPNNRCPQLLHTTSRCAAYLSVHQTEQQTHQKKLNKKKKMLKMKKSPTNSEVKEINHLQKVIEDIKMATANLRSLRVTISCENFYSTGFMADIVTHVLTLSLACFHARLHLSFEDKIQYKFANRALLELAMIHPSFKQNYGMTADHARNALLTCGYKRQFKYEKNEDLKRMGGFTRMAEMIQGNGLRVKPVQIIHNERLEYLGDAVVEMIVTNRLFFMLPHHQEGGLATYRSAIVQNRNLAALAENMGLNNFLLFTHGPDLCHEGDFRHALANAFEAVMGAIYLDSGLEEADRIFAEALYPNDSEAKDIWININVHELQEEYPDGDRHMIITTQSLKGLPKLEETIGYQFEHVRILAKAMTRRCIPFNDVTRGHNQRLEWLGDTVLQLIVSEYLYRHFPHHNEGHLSLLRTCIVSNKTQSLICDELRLYDFCIRPPKNSDTGQVMKMKDKADLVEALLGAIFVDGGWPYCQNFVRIMFLPRLKYFLVQKRWSDEKSQLQHACLALRNIRSKKPECPQYRMLSQSGPTNSRTYTVGVFFRNKKLAEGTATNLHNAEMEAAKNGLDAIRHLLDGFDDVPHRPSSSNSKHSTAIPSTSRNIPSLMSFGLPPAPSIPFYPPQYPYLPFTGVPMPFPVIPTPPTVITQPTPLMQTFPPYYPRQ